MKGVIGLMMAMLAGTVGAAQTATWIGGTSGSWGNSLNWDTGVVPVNGDTARFAAAGEEIGSAVEVSLDGDRAVTTLASTNIVSVTITGGSSPSTLTVSSDIKGTVYSPLTYGTDVTFRVSSGKQINSYGVTSFHGGLESPSNPLFSFGTFVIDGSVNIGQDLRFSSTEVDWSPKSATVGGNMVFTGGSFSPNGRPVIGTPAMFTGVPTIGGTAPLSFNCGGAKPDMVVNQFANSTQPIYRTFPVCYSWFALCSSSTSPNNGAVGFLPGSGSRLELSKVTSVAADGFVTPSGDNDHGALRFAYRGNGSTVNFKGSQNIVAQGPRSTHVAHSDGVGYNAFELTAGGDGVKSIRPFGNGALYTNNGHGIFIRAGEPGLTVDNGLIYGSSVNNRNAYSFGFDGTNALTIAGDVVFENSGYSMFPLLAEAPLTFTGAFDVKACYLDFIGTGDVVLDSTTIVGGTTGRVSKHSSGRMTLKGVMAGATYNKAYFAGGETVFDYADGDVNRLNTTNSGTALADALRLRGTSLVLKGGSVAETVGATNGTTYSHGLSKISRDGGTGTIYLGTMKRDDGNTTTFQACLDLEDGIASTAVSQAGTVFDGSVTVGRDSYAQVTAEGQITRAPDTVATKITASMSSASLVQNRFIIEPTTDGQVLNMSAASSPFVANLEGMIFRGPYDFEIRGGWMAGRNTYNYSLFFHHAGTGVVTFDGKLDRYGFIKTGPGTFRYAGTSNLSQTLGLFEGVFEAASATAFSPASKSTYNVYLNGGTLKTSVDVQLDRPISVGDNGGTIDVVEGTTFTVAGTTISSLDGTSGPIAKKGGGIVFFASDMTAQSEFDLLAGTAKLGHEWGLGCSTNRTRAIAPTKIKGGTLDVAGFKAHLGNVTLRGGSIVDSSLEKTGSLGAYVFWAENGTVDVPLTDVINPCKENVFVANDLEKVTSGTVTLSAANEFTGTAFVHEGVLNLTGSLAGSAWVDGGLLTGTGSIAGYVYVTGTGVLEPVAGSTMSFGDKFAISSTGRLRIGATANEVAKIVLTGDDAAVYLAEGATLDFPAGAPGALYGEHVIVDLPAGASVEGEFANFVNGCYRDGRGHKFLVGYHGGDGNDIVLSAMSTGLSVILR